MGLLPGLRRDTDRWWLPCSLMATEVLTELLLQGGHGQGLNLATRQRLHRAVLIDPPLMIFAALSLTSERVASGDSSGSCQVSPQDLVDWLARNFQRCVADGNAYLGEPVVTPAIELQWNRLRDHYRTLPYRRWLQDAAVWLEVTGPKVPGSWQQQWPFIELEHESAEGLDAPESLSPPATPFHGLQQLSRQLNQHRSLNAAFDQQLRKVKLSALRQLAYGLSHEINNPLANISTRAQQLQRDESDPSRAATLQRIVDQVYRAHEMIADLMFYAHPQSATIQSTEIGSLLTAIVEDYRAEAQRQAIRLELELPRAASHDQPRAVNLPVDPRMISEAVGSLIRNAIEAIGCQGTIVLSLSEHPSEVVIEVADSGPGLSREARQHAFDPYFSGREAGRGLGLGLCRAYRIVRLHHGRIALSGGPVGCIATITLPKTQSASETSAISAGVSVSSNESRARDDERWISGR